MRIAYVSGNQEQLPDAVIPLGLLYVMASTPERHEKELVDLCFEENPQETLTRRLEDLQPDAVALGTDFDGASRFPVGLEHVGKLPALTAGLLSKGWTTNELRGVLGKNLLD